MLTINPLYGDVDSRRWVKLKLATGPLTRSSADMSLLIAHVGKNRIGDKSFYVSAPSLWNSLPRNIREACTLSRFKKVLKSHLYPSN